MKIALCATHLEKMILPQDREYIGVDHGAVSYTHLKSVAILHSKLSAGERYDEYRRIIGDEVKIVVRCV